MAGERGHALRLAVAADAEALALVHIKSWREIYKDVVPGARPRKAECRQACGILAFARCGGPGSPSDERMESDDGQKPDLPLV